MPEAEQQPSPRRQRPSYGLPGSAAAPSEPMPSQPAPAPSTSPGWAAAPPPPPPRRRRRGGWSLGIGLALLLILAPVLFIGGIVWAMGAVIGDAAGGPTPLEGQSQEIELPANEMLLVYVPVEDAGSAACTAEGTGVQTVPSSGEVTFGDGTEYVQQLGAVAGEDTTVTLSCTGTEGAAYLGPYDVMGMMAPLVIGPILGVLAGLLGLILTIIGIVLLVRSARR